MATSVVRVAYTMYEVLRAVVISTGDELVYQDETLGPGKIYDSNMYTIAARLKSRGVSREKCKRQHEGAR